VLSIPVVKFKDELGVANPDLITISEGRISNDSRALQLYSVGRPRIVDHETGPGVNDDCVTAADFRVRQDDFVVGQAADPGGRPLHRIALACGRTQPCNRFTTTFAAVDHADDGLGGGSAGRLLNIQWLLSQNPSVQIAKRRVRVDAQVVGEGNLQALVGI
jgi:hypothetical protein